MSLFAYQVPQSPNVAYTNLMYVIGSPSYQEPQFKYICDIFVSGSSDRISRIRTVPNSEGYGVFDVSVPIQNYLEFDTAVPKAGISSSVNYRIDSSSREFYFEFGEEYGTSPSSSLTQFLNQSVSYTGGNIPSPKSFWKGTIDQQQNNSFSYNLSSFQIISTSESVGYPLLSEKPTSSRYASINDWETVSLLRGDIGDGWAYYSASVNFNGVSSSISFGQDMDWSGSTATSGFVLSVGVGPKNIVEANILGGLDFENYLYYDVYFHYRNLSTAESFITEPIQYINTSYPFSSNWEIGPELAGGTTTPFVGGYAGISSAGTLNDAILTLGTTQQRIGTQRTHKWNGSVWSLGANFPTDYWYGAAAGQSSEGTISVCGNIYLSAPHSNQTVVGGASGWATSTNYPLLLAGLDGCGIGSASAAFVGGQYWTGVAYDEVSTQYVFNGSTYSSPTGLPQKSTYHLVIGDSINDYLVIGGYVNGAISDVSYQWDGSSFTAISNYPLDIMQHAGVGTTSDAFVYGGFDFTQEIAASYKWDGTSWSADAPLIAARAFMGHAGSSTACFAAGGGAGELGIVTGTVLTDILGDPLPSNQASPSQFYGTTNVDKVEPLPVCYDETRFAFINNLGTWDYYSIFNPINKTTNLTRESVDLPNVDYNGATSPYNISNRGKTTYYTSNEDVYQITTDPLSQENADWLTEMIESPNVYIQSGDNFIPVNIRNAQYTWRTNPKGQKLFQYTIDFSYSNNRRSTY